MADRAPRRPQIRVWYANGGEWRCTKCGLPLGVVQDDRLTIVHHQRSITITAPWCIVQRCECGHVNYWDRSA